MTIWLAIFGDPVARRRFNPRSRHAFTGRHEHNTTWVIGLTYSYGTTSNNGNIQSISYSGGGLSYTQSFTYDSLNRLSTATETNGGTSWSQTNAYDRYGNRQIDYGGGSYNLAFSSTTNRITTSGYSYDSSGNLTSDGSHTYGYDADSKIKSVDS